MDCSGCNKCTDVNCSIETKCQQLDRSLLDKWGAISYPIYQTATFAHPGLGDSTGYDYTRMQNPTRKQLESIVSFLKVVLTPLPLQAEWQQSLLSWSCLIPGYSLTVLSSSRLVIACLDIQLQA